MIPLPASSAPGNTVSSLTVFPPSCFALESPGRRTRRKCKPKGDHRGGTRGQRDCRSGYLELFRDWGVFSALEMEMEMGLWRGQDSEYSDVLVSKTVDRLIQKDALPAGSYDKGRADAGSVVRPFHFVFVC